MGDVGLVDPREAVVLDQRSDAHEVCALIFGECAELGGSDCDAGRSTPAAI